MKGEDMEDLIDRQSVIDLLKKSASRDIEEVVVTEKNIKLIMDMPKAYDVKKVIEDLASNSRFIDDINKHNIKCISCVIGQKTAIDIVKRGGVE